MAAVGLALAPSTPAVASPASTHETAAGRAAASGPFKRDPFSGQRPRRFRPALTRSGRTTTPTPPTAAVRPTATVTQTTADLVDALTSKRPREWVSTPAPGSQVIAVNGQIRYQRITGFGAAMTDSSAYLLQDQLTPEAHTIAMQALFGQPGIHLNFVRIPMGASDFSATGVPYTYDDLAAGQTDPTLAGFSINHDLAYILPALQAMLAENPKIITYANPWTPPPWMKVNGLYGNVGAGGRVMPQFYPALAQYFVKFIQAYAALGVPIDDISLAERAAHRCGVAEFGVSGCRRGPVPDREPAPALQAAGLTPHVYGLEETANPTDEQTLFAGPAAPYLSGVAFHCYGGMAGFTAFHHAFPTVPIAVTECSPGIINYSASEVAIDATSNWASVATLWNLALDTDGGPVQPPDSGCRGCTGVIRVNEHHASGLVRAELFRVRPDQQVRRTRRRPDRLDQAGRRRRQDRHPGGRRRRVHQPKREEGARSPTTAPPTPVPLSIKWRAQVPELPDQAERDGHVHVVLRRRGRAAMTDPASRSYPTEGWRFDSHIAGQVRQSSRSAVPKAQCRIAVGRTARDANGYHGPSRRGVS